VISTIDQLQATGGFTITNKGLAHIPFGTGIKESKLIAGL
jgi:hypothetical protein